MKQFSRITLAVALVAMAIGTASPALAGSEKPKYMADPTSAADKLGDSHGLSQFAAHMSSRFRKKVHGRITAISETSITIDAQRDPDNHSSVDVNESYTFAITDKTKFVRRFFGTATVDELAIGHRVRIWSEKFEEGTARLIWDKSIWWVRLGGKVADVNDEAMTFNLMIPRRNRDNQAVTFFVKVRVNEKTKYFWKDGTTATFADLENLQNVKLRGSWDNIVKSVLAKHLTLTPLE